MSTGKRETRAQRMTAKMLLLLGMQQSKQTYFPPAVVGTRRGTLWLRGRARGIRRSWRSRWGLPHQSRNERTRRLWQVHEDRLTGGVTRKRPGGEREHVPFVSDEARHVAHGILPGNHRRGVA